MFHDLDTTDMIQNDIHDSYDNFGFDDKVVDDVLLCNIDEEQSNMFDNQS